MIRKFRIFCSVLLAIAFGVTASAAAQGTPVSADDGEVSPQKQYVRIYAPTEAMVTNPDTPTGEYQFIGLTIMVTTFSTDESAAQVFEASHEETAREIIREEGLEQEERDSLGDRAVFYSGEELADDDPLPVSLLLILDGNAIYHIAIQGNDTALAGTMLDDISAFMVDAETNDAEVMYDMNGDSTGGAFDLMPGRDDTAITAGLEPLIDMDFTGSDLVEETYELQLPDVEGILSGYARMYSPDLDAMDDGDATPDANMQIPDDMVFLMTTGLTFDSEANAAAGFDSIGDSFARRMMSPDGVVTQDVDDLGDKALLYTGQSDFAVDPLPVAVLLVQEGEMVHMTMVEGGDKDESIEFAEEVARFIVDGEIVTTEVVVNPDGPTSTGGVFDLMPDAEDTDVLRGLVPMVDMDLMG